MSRRSATRMRIQRAPTGPRIAPHRMAVYSSSGRMPPAEKANNVNSTSRNTATLSAQIIGCSP